MGSSNTFSRAMKHLKADKPSGLFESVPTNNTQDLYQVEPDTLVEINPDIDVPDFNQDGDGSNAYTGEDTSGLFMPDGTIRVIEPPGNTTAILGPMATMWYSWGNFSTFGYIRQSDRRMVNLGRITGKLSDWDGVSNFTSYNNDFTIDQAVWFRDTPKYGGVDNDPANHNYRAFYPGPPSNIADQYGRYLCSITGTPKNQTTGVKGPKVGPDQAGFPWGMIGDALKGLGNLFGDTLSAIQGTGAAQFLARALRSLTDSAVYAGDYIFKGLAEGVEYLPDFTGAGDIFGIKVPKIADWPGALARTIGGGDNAVSQFLDNAVQGVLGKNYATQYFTPDLDTAVKYAGESGTVVAIPRTEGMTGWKNWFGSNVSRGFDPSKGVEQLVSSADAVAADAAGATQQFALNNADDVARLQQLASKGSKANSLLGKLGRAVPFVGAAAATADVSIRTANGDYAGAVLGGISAIPGPVGWVGLGAQVISDIAGITNPNSASNQFLGAVFGGQSTSGRGAGRASFQEEYLLTEEEQMENAKAMREALFELGLPRDIKEFAKQQTIYLMAMGVNPGLVSIIARTIVGEKLTVKEKKYIKNKFPALIAIMVGGAEAKAKKVVKDHNGIHNVKLASTAKLPKFAPQKTMKPSGIKESHTLDVIKNIKKPVVIEEKKEKVKRRPRVIGSEPRTLNTSLMKQAEVPASFKKPEERMWGKYEREQNARASQDRKNVVLDHLGNADQAWEYLLDRNAGKRSFAGYFEKDGTPRTIFTDGKVKTVTREEKVGTDTLIFFTDEEGKKGSILQSEYNELQDQAHTQQIFAEYEATVAAEQETAFDKITHKLELRAEKNPTNGKIESMLSSYRALSHLRKEDKKQTAHFTSWKSSIDGTITSNFQSWVDSVGQETADAVTKVALTEKMSSSNLFGATLPATGDYDHIDMTFDSTYLDPDNDDIVNGAGSGSGYQGGFPVADGENDVIQLSAFGEYSASAYTTDQDLTYVDTLSVTAIAGNGNNGGITPINGLDVYFLGDDDWAGPFTVAPASQSSYVNAQITIPENLRTKNVAIYLYSDTSDYVNGMNFSVRHFGNQTFNVPGLDFTNIRNLFAWDDPGEENGEDFLSYFFRNYSRSSSSNMKSIGHYYWYNVNAQRFGVVDDTREASEGGNFWPQWPSPPINSDRTNGDSGGNYAGQPRDEDYIRIGEMIWDQFVGTKLWGISNISFKRKAPASVYVPLDSPEAINFMRTAPEMKGLTPAQRLKKLKEMLAAGNEYLIKMLGVSGSTATPGPNEPADYLDGADELFNDVSPEEQAEIEKNLAKLGPEYAEIAAIPAALPLLASPAGQAALAAGAAAVGTLLIQAGINVSGTDWGAAPGRETVGNLPGTGGTSGGRDLTADQQAEVQAAADELRDARRALNDVEDNPDSTETQRAQAQERLDRASKNRQRVRNKHKQENKNRKESYEVKSSGKKYLSDSKTFKKKSFSNWYSSMESEISDKAIEETKRLIEGMTSGSLFQANLPAMGDVPLDTVSDTTISDSDLFGPYQDYGDPDYAISPQIQTLGTVDASEYDTLKLTIGGSFNTRVVDGSSLDDKISIGVLVGGTYGGNYLAQGLGAGTHVISIPSRFQKANVKFDALVVTAIQGVTGSRSITNIEFQRRNSKTIFVSLDSPEAVNFIRTDPMMKGLTPQQQLDKLKEMLEAGNEYLLQQLGYIGSTATPGPDEVAQALPYTDEDDAFDNPYYDDPFKDPGDLDDSDDESTWDYAKEKGDTETAQMSPKTEAEIDAMLLRGLERGDYGTGPQIQKQIDSLKRNQRNKTPGGIPRA